MLKTINQGCEGNTVKIAQYLTGYAKRKEASGVFDAYFVAHMCTWQRKYGLSPDGVIGPATWAMIAKRAPTCSTSRNRTSAATCAVQILIGGLTVDGIYGPKTKRGVAAFQAAAKLTSDGICGPMTWTALITGRDAQDADEDTEDETAAPADSEWKRINSCVHYIQWDKRWKNVKYSTHISSQTIGNSGCGPTAMADIMATFIDPAITPVEMCEMAVKSGNRTYNNGTSWSFFPYVFKCYSAFSKFIATTNITTLKAALADGALAVCSVNSNDNGFWTSGGHFITVIGYDEDGYIYANDPNKSAAPRKQQQNKFKACLKQAFIFWPAAKVKPPGTGSTGKETSAGTAQAGAIIDISKWQGNINFDKLGKAVALVIARVTSGSDKDPRFDEYAQAMVKRGIPFGVYGYSYASTAARARKEAKLMVEYAKKYKPLFFVIDAEEERLTQEIISACAAKLRALGVTRMGCYVAHNRYKDYGYESLRGLFEFTWIPRYGKNTGTIAGAKKPAYACDLWQFTSAGSISGINGNVDMNTITDSGKTLEWFLGGDD